MVSHRSSFFNRDVGFGIALHMEFKAGSSDRLQLIERRYVFTL